MNKLYTFNKWFYIGTIILYISVIGGLLAQILLGFIQVFSALGLLTDWKNLSLQTKKHLFIYGSIIIVYGLLWPFITHENDIYILYMTLIPMMIAGYFVYITYLDHKHQLMNKTRLDRIQPKNNFPF